MGQKQSQICPIYMKSLEVSSEIERRFIVCPHPLYTNREEFKLLHEKLTNKKFMLRIITADESQKKLIEAKILKRVAFKNGSLTKLQHYIFETLETYCSKQFKIYLLFELDPSTTLREQILMQGKGESYFTQQEIIAGFQNLINGLLWVRYFKEKHGNINTHHIYCSNHKMILSDPLLCPESHEFPQKYPSPEKLKEINNKIDEYNYYESDIFSIAMCMLEIIPTVKLDGIYKRNYTINQKNLREEINKCYKYPKLKAIFQSLLIDPYNLENRKRYLEIYSNKCNYLFKQLTESSVSSEKTVKIHTLGKSSKHEQKQKSFGYSHEHGKNQFMHFPPTNSSINPIDKPEIDTNILDKELTKPILQSPPFQRKQNNYGSNEMFSKQLSTNNSRYPNFNKKIVFNYNNQNQCSHLTSFNQLKTVSSNKFIPAIDSSNFQVPHHLYQFNTSPYNPKPRIETSTSNNNFISRSSSDMSVKSELVVYQPKNSSFNISELISPRQESSHHQNLVKQADYFNTTYNKTPYTYYSQKIDFPRYQHINHTHNFYQQPPSFNALNTINHLNQLGEPATSFGILQNEKINNQKQSHVFKNQEIKQQIENKVNQSGSKQIENDQLENLPLKLSILVKNNISDSNILHQDHEKQEHSQIYKNEQEVNSISSLKTPEKSIYAPILSINRTIPEEQPEEEQSFEGAQKISKGQYKMEQYENGGRYEGFFVNNMRNGYGTFYYKDGGYYQGEWKQNLMNGHGKLYYDHDRLAYDGQWYNDEFHGKGKVYNDNWEDLQGSLDYETFDKNQLYWVEYDGELSHDVKDGFGKWKFSNGQYYEGQFKDDLPSGRGIFYSHKSVIKGFWNKGKLLMKI